MKFQPNKRNQSEFERQMCPQHDIWSHKIVTQESSKTSAFKPRQLDLTCKACASCGKKQNSGTAVSGSTP